MLYVCTKLLILESKNKNTKTIPTEIPHENQIVYEYNDYNRAPIFVFSFYNLYNLLHLPCF